MKIAINEACEGVQNQGFLYLFTSPKDSVFINILAFFINILADKGKEK